MRIQVRIRIYNRKWRGIKNICQNYFFYNAHPIEVVPNVENFSLRGIAYPPPKLKEKLSSIEFADTKTWSISLLNLGFDNS